MPSQYLPRKHGISNATLCTWKARSGGMMVLQARRLRPRPGTHRRGLANRILELSPDGTVADFGGSDDDLDASGLAA